MDSQLSKGLAQVFPSRLLGFKVVLSLSRSAALAGAIVDLVVTIQILVDVLHLCDHEPKIRGVAGSENQCHVSWGCCPRSAQSFTWYIGGGTVPTGPNIPRLSEVQ